MITTISTLPDIPSRNDPGTFSDRADSFLGAMPTLVSELNNFVSEVNTLSFKTACKVATIGPITLSGTQTIDFQSVVAGDRVLVKDQSTSAQNGIYIASSTTWTRAADMDTVSEVAGSFIPITYGNTNGGKIFYTTFNATGATLGTTSIPWISLTEASITGVGTLAVQSGGTGLASYTSGDLIYATGTTSLAKLAAAASGNVLKSGTAPSWGKVALASDVSGTLPVANGGTGSTTLTANGVLLGNGTSALQAVSPGNIGNILTSTGSTWTSSPMPASYVGPSAQILSSGSFTVPSGITKLKVTVIGGGGGGGNASTTNSVGGGGGAGAVVAAWLTGLTPGASISVTVGSGGSGGNPGTTSSFGTYCTATGGGAGTSNITSSTPTGAGAGGTASGGIFNENGSNGGTAYFQPASGGCCGTPSVLYSGSGASLNSKVPLLISGFGGSGKANVVGNGNSATGYGSGGGGATRGSSGAWTGGSGTNGFVFVEW